MLLETSERAKKIKDGGKITVDIENPDLIYKAIQEEETALLLQQNLKSPLVGITARLGYEGFRNQYYGLQANIHVKQELTQNLYKARKNEPDLRGINALVYLVSHKYNKVRVDNNQHIITAPNDTGFAFRKARTLQISEAVEITTNVFTNVKNRRHYPPLSALASTQEGFKNVMQDFSYVIGNTIRNLYKIGKVSCPDIELKLGFSKDA